MNNHNKWTCGDSNPGPTGYEPVALTNWATGPHMKADERTRTVNLLITNQLLCQLSHIGIFCFYMLHRSIGRAQASLVCSPLIDKVNKPELSHIGVCIFPIACRSKISFSRSQDDSKGIWTPVTAVKGRCLNRLTMEPCFLSLSLFVSSCFFFPLPRPSHLFFNAKKLPSRARTYNPSVNSRVLYHWAIEDYSFSLRWNCYSFWLYTQNHTLKSFIRGDNSSFLPSWISPRPISISQLHVLPHFHLWPINLVVFKGS